VVVAALVLIHVGRHHDFSTIVESAGGWAGAVVGDSSLFLIAQAGRRIEPQITEARSNQKVALALDLMGENAPLLIMAGRDVPGLRFAVNAMMGLSRMPYRRFLPPVGSRRVDVVLVVIVHRRRTQAPA